MFKLQKYYSITSALIILPVVAMVVYLFHSYALDHAIKNGEAQNIEMAKVLSNALHKPLIELLTVNDFDSQARMERIRDLHNQIARISKNIPVVKVKFYSLDGMTQYSSAFSQIGLSKKGNPRFTESRDTKKAISKMSFRESFGAFSGTKKNIHVVETYIPFFQDNNDEILAVFELYSDVSHLIDEAYVDVYQVTAILLATSALLYLVLLIIIRRADKILKNQNAIIQKNTEAKSSFMRGLSHDLKNPLNSMIGYAQLMQSDNNLNEEQKDNLQEIRNGGMHLLDLINDIMDLSKIESGQLSVNINCLNLHAVVNDCLLMSQSLAEKRHIILENNIPKEQMVMADDTRLRQVLLNLVSNGIKYNKDGGTVSIRAETAHQPDRLRVSVIDTGIGLNDKQIRKLFKAFERLGVEKTDIEGTGIGLVITQQLIELMNGSIGIESLEGQGTSFWFELPTT